jgi:hypothetical protein
MEKQVLLKQLRQEVKALTLPKTQFQRPTPINTMTTPITNTITTTQKQQIAKLEHSQAHQSRVHPTVSNITPQETHQDSNETTQGFIGMTATSSAPPPLINSTHTRADEDC